MASKMKVPTADELEQRAAVEKSLVEAQTPIEADDQAEERVEAKLPPPQPTEPVPRIKRRVRVEEIFYWVQGPGLPGVPVPANSELVLEDAEIASLIHTGAKLLLLDETLRARLQRVISDLPADRVDPAHLAGEIASVEASLAVLISKLKAG